MVVWWISLVFKRSNLAFGRCLENLHSILLGVVFHSTPFLLSVRHSQSAVILIMRMRLAISYDPLEQFDDSIELQLNFNLQVSLV